MLPSADGVMTSTLRSKNRMSPSVVPAHMSPSRSSKSVSTEPVERRSNVSVTRRRRRPRLVPTHMRPFLS